MDEIELLQILDYLLSILKDNKLHSLNGLVAKMQSKYPKLTFDEGRIFIQKLLDDKLIQTEKSDIQFRIKLSGRVFIGYWNERILEDENIAKISQTASYQKDYKERLFWATLSAGIFAGLLLLWQVWIWFYPVHANYPYWIWETIPKKSK
jgi:hypothetical protein